MTRSAPADPGRPAEPQAAISGVDPDRAHAAFDVPVALSVFTRPECVRRLLAALRTVRPRLLLVFADAPRPERSEDATRCREARAVLDEVDWPCEVRWNVADTNLGPRERIQSGLAWVFEQVEEAIFFEEDCIPDPTFLLFCRELLTRYRDDARVLLICGMRGRSPAPPPGPESYDFSTNPNLYGWATWRRTWALYEPNVDSWPALRSTRWLRRIVGSRAEARVWAKRFDLVRKGLDTWDYSLIFSCWKARGLSIRPRYDLVQNIGFGSHGTNTLDADSEVARRRARPMVFPLIHPKQVDSWEVARKRARGAKSIGSGPWELGLPWRERLRERVVRHCRPMSRSGRLRRILRFPCTVPVELLAPVGSSLDLAGRGVANHTLPCGWSFPESGGRWTVGLRAIVVWRAPDEVEQDLTCSLDASPALCPSQPGLRVDLFVNDALCAATSYGSAPPANPRGKAREGVERFRIPRTLLRPRARVVMMLVVRWPLVPAEHDLSDDFRPLGLFVRTIRFEGIVTRTPSS